MASATELLRLLIDADTQGAVQGVERLGSTSERELSRSEKALDRWGNRLTTVGTGMVTFGAAALVGLARAGQAASDLNEAASKSATVFGSAAGEVARFAEGAADIGLSERAALSAASTFGNLFTQVGLGADRAADMSIELTKLAADFASFHNADITAVIEAQTAAFRGEYDALQAFVPTINAATVQQRAMAQTGKDNADALTEGEKAAATYALMIEGAGAAMGDFDRTSDSAANRQRQLTATWENLKATIGEGVLPVMETGLGVVTDLAGGFSRLDVVTGGAAGKVATYGALALVAGGATSTLVGQALKARENLSSLASGIASVGSRISGGQGFLAGIRNIGIGLGILAPLAIAAGIALQSYADTKAEAARITGVLTDALEKEAEGTEGATNAALAHELTAGDLGSTLREAGADLQVFNQAIRRSGDDIERLEDVKHSPQALSNELDRLAEGGSALGRELRRLANDSDVSDGEFIDLISRLDELSAGYGSATEATRNADFAEGQLADQHGETAAATGEVTDATQQAEQALEEYSERLRGMFDPLFAAQDAMLDVRDAQAALSGAELELVAAQQAYNQALEDHGPDSDQAREAALALMDAQTGLESATIAAGRSTVDLAVAQETLRSKVESGEISVREAKDEIFRMAIAAGFNRDQALRLANGFDVATSAARRYDGRYNADITTTGVGGAIGAANNVRRAMNEIPRNVQVRIAVRTAIDRIGDLVGLGGRQHGGPVPPGWVGWVGEAGPELLVMGPGGGGGHVYTEQQVRAGTTGPGMGDGLGSAKARGSVGGGTPSPVVIDMRGSIVASDTQFERMVVGALQRAGESGRPVTIRGRRL